MTKKILLIMFSLFIIGASSLYAQNNNRGYATAILSGGCFWCTEADLEKLPGVVNVVSGYAGGKEVKPSYKEVAGGKTSHKEAVHVTYNPNIISYEKLLNAFLRTIDPTDATGSFVDRGRHYTAAIYTFSDAQKIVAEKFISRMQNSPYFGKKQIAIEVIPYSTFYEAENYHQDYAEKNEWKYSFYRSRSGRDTYIKNVWNRIPQSFLLSN